MLQVKRGGRAAVEQLITHPEAGPPGPYPKRDVSERLSTKQSEVSEQLACRRGQGVSQYSIAQ